MENQQIVEKNATTIAKRRQPVIKSDVESDLESILESIVESDVESIVESDAESIVESDEELAINEKVRLVDLEKGKYYIPRCSKIEVENEKNGGLLLLADVESDGFKNVIVNYKYIREFRKLLENYEYYQICVKVIEDQFVSAGKLIDFNKLEFKVYKEGTLKKLRRVLKNRNFIDKFDEEFADEIIEKVYNEDKNMEEHFLLWSDDVDEKEKSNNRKKLRSKKIAARNICRKK